MLCPVDVARSGVVRCVHKVGKQRGSGDGVRDVAAVGPILEDINDRSRLLAKRYPFVCAYKIDLVPTLCRDWVLVVFEVEAGIVQTIRTLLRGTERDFFDYYEIPTSQGGYLTVDVLGFVNAPGFKSYQGPIRFQDSFRVREGRQERDQLAVPPPAR
jgi:hypothetical protein